MEDALSMALTKVYQDLAGRKAGSVRTAQRITKLLRKAGRNSEATNLVREYNRHAKHMHREDW